MYEPARHGGAGLPRRLHAPRPRIYAGPHSVVVCPECRVVSRDGRWSWEVPPRARARAGRCPACHRIRAARPAGTLRLPRGLFTTDSDALLLLVRHAEEQERLAYPLERVMSVQADRDGLTVTTTGVYLAGVITGKLERRLRRQPRVCYQGSGEVGVEWTEPGNDELAYQEARA